MPGPTPTGQQGTNGTGRRWPLAVVTTPCGGHARAMFAPHPLPGSVVVAADGSDHAMAAVEWAARQAILERRALSVVHADETRLLDARAWARAEDGGAPALLRTGHQTAVEVVDEAVAAARAVAPGVRVAGVIVDDDPRQALLAAGRIAHLLVLGSRGRGPARSLLLGSVSAGVVRHAECPVVVARPGTGTGARGIVVGTDGSAASRLAVEFAFQLASFRQTPLVVVHSTFDVLARAGRTVLSDLEDPSLLLAESLAGLREKYPTVDVQTEVLHGLVDQALTENAPPHELLVVGRAPTTTLGDLGGSISLSVLERARGMVAVVPEPRHT